MTPSTSTSLPHWDLSNVYPSLESPELAQAVTELDQKIADLQYFIRQAGLENLAAADPVSMKPIIEGCI